MVTGVIENGVKKCEKYWPTEFKSPVQYGNIVVKVLSKKSNPDWITTKFLLRKVNLIVLNLNLHRCILPYLFK